MSPFFSIIIPVYNVAPYLRECLDSVLAQSFTDWEAICVDDGSTDGSGLILDDYAAIDDRFTVIHKMNGGVGSARNVALDRMDALKRRKGLLWFVDADDAIHPESLDWIVRMFNQHQDAKFLAVYPEDVYGESIPSVWPKVPMPGAEIEYRKYDGESVRGSLRPVCGVIYRREYINNLRFKNYTVGEDSLFSSEFYWKTDCWLSCKAPVYFYRQRIGSALHRSAELTAASDWMAAEKDILFLFKNNANKYLRADMANVLLRRSKVGWYTFRHLFFRLSDKDMKALLPEWLELQRCSQDLVKWGLYRRLAVNAIEVTNSTLLCKFLVLTPEILHKCASYAWRLIKN